MQPNAQYDYKSKQIRLADNRNKTPKNQFFRSSLKSKQDLGFLRHHRQDNINTYQIKNPSKDANLRETLNRPEHTKYISQTTKNQTKLFNNFFRGQEQQKTKTQAMMVGNKSVEKRGMNRQQYTPTNLDNLNIPKFMSENIKPEQSNHEYQRLHDKLNYLEDKISEMRVNLERRKQEKKKYFQKQINQRNELMESQASMKKIVSKNTNTGTSNHISTSNNIIASNGNEKTNKASESLMKQMVTQVPHQKKLKPFTFDPYSPRHNIYYVSQIVRAYKQDNSLARQHLINSMQLLRIMGRTRVPTQVQVNSRKLNLTRKPQYQDKKVVILDLDQTLIHCNQNTNMVSDVKLPIKFPTGQVIEAGINIRPYAVEFLKNISKNFEVIVFTASHSCYANVVLNHLDPDNKYIAHRLFREHCFHSNQSVYIKDLRIINRQMSQLVLVDNAAYSYAFQQENGIPIIPYYQGKIDFELKALQTYLQGMMFSKDVREVNKNIFKLHRYLDFDTPEALVKQLYLNQDHR